VVAVLVKRFDLQRVERSTMDHEMEGGHAVISVGGMEVLRKYGGAVNAVGGDQLPGTNIEATAAPPPHWNTRTARWRPSPGQIVLIAPTQEVLDKSSPISLALSQSAVEHLQDLLDKSILISYDCGRSFNLTIRCAPILASRPESIRISIPRIEP
jgi:hypothetical protein